MIAKLKIFCALQHFNLFDFCIDKSAKIYFLSCVIFLFCFYLFNILHQLQFIRRTMYMNIYDALYTYIIYLNMIAFKEIHEVKYELLLLFCSREFFTDLPKFPCVFFIQSLRSCQFLSVILFKC